MHFEISEGIMVPERLRGGIEGPTSARGDISRAEVVGLARIGGVVEFRRGSQKAHTAI